MTDGYEAAKAQRNALERLGAKIRSSSSFRFAWQFFTFDCFDASSPRLPR